MAKPITISIVGNAGPLKKAIKESEDALSKMGRSFANAAKVFAVGAAAIGAGAAAAISKASDLSETISKVGVIFGDADKQIQEFAKTAASSLGQTRQQALDAAATFGIFGKAAGLSGSELATFSTGLTSLASDLASFNNTSPEQAINAIGAALRGEAEPLRQYGVLLNDATLKQAAMELGIYNGNGALDAQQKILAAQKVIFEQTGDAQGDFARTSEGLANQTRILKAQLENVVTTIGMALLPIAQELVGWISNHILPVIERWANAIDEGGLSGLLRQITEDIKSWYAELDTSTQLILNLVAALGALAGAMKVFTVFSAATAAIKTMSGAVSGLSIAIFGVGTTISGAAAVIGGAVAAITLSFYLLSQDGFGVFKGLANAAIDFANVVIDVFNAVAKSAAQWVNIMIDAINLVNPFSDIPRFEVADVIGNIGYRFSGVFPDAPSLGGMQIGISPDRMDVSIAPSGGGAGGGTPSPAPNGTGGKGGGNRLSIDPRALELGGLNLPTLEAYGSLESARLADLALLDTAQPSPVIINVNTVTADENLPTVIVDALQRYNLIYGPAEIDIAV